MFSLDKRIDKNIKKESEKNKRELIFEDTELVLADEYENRIHEDEFIGISSAGTEFTEESVEKDKKLVESIKHNFQMHIEHLSERDIEKIVNGKKRADALEVTIAEVGELYDWAGKNAYFIRSSEYDDLVNGVDIILEFDVPHGSEEDPRRVAITIDASMKGEKKTVFKKIERNILKITEGVVSSYKKEPEVKYFKSSATDYKGPLPLVIPVVVGLEEDNANELISLYASTKKLKKMSASSEIAKGILKSKNETLESHPAQGVFYEEIIMQLKYYAEILSKSEYKGKDEKLEEIKSALKQFFEIASQKGKIVLGEYGNDTIFKFIKEKTEGVKI